MPLSYRPPSPSPEIKHKSSRKIGAKKWMGVPGPEGTRLSCAFWALLSSGIGLTLCLPAALSRQPTTMVKNNNNLQVF